MATRRWALLSIAAMMACLSYFGLIRLADFSYWMRNPPSGVQPKPFVPPPSKPSVSIPEPAETTPTPLQAPVLPGLNAPPPPPR